MKEKDGQQYEKIAKLEKDLNRILEEKIELNKENKGLKESHRLKLDEEFKKKFDELE